MDKQQRLEAIRREFDEGKDTLKAALDYAGMGWAVLPLHAVEKGRCTCGDADCGSPGKHPRTEHGLKDATSDPDAIRAWWAAWPDSNVGVRTGAESGIVVLDVDPRHGGGESLSRIEAEHDGLDGRAVAVTGGGGLHYIFAHPGRMVGNRVGAFGYAGIDVRGDGGYIVAPPSTHASGRRYWWADLCEPELLAGLPQWLTRPERRRPEPQAAADAVSEGRRNEHLFSVAVGVVKRGGGPSAVQAAVTAENAARCAPPLDAGEVKTIARSAIQYPTTATTAPVLKTTGGTVLPIHFTLTDEGNAQRFAAGYAGRVRHCWQQSSWYVWDGRRWAADDGGQVLELAKGTVRNIFDEMAAVCTATRDDDERSKLAKAFTQHIGQSLKRDRLKAMVELAGSIEGIVVRPGELDKDPWRLNVLNGTLDLRTGALTPHDPADLMTKMAPAAYDADAESDLWRRFLDDSTGGDAALAGFLQRAVGYTLTGSTREEVLFFVHGPAASGKSTFLEAVKAALGDYARTADFETFLQRSFTGGPRPDIARLAGARMVSSIEVDEGKRLAEGLVKTLTGGDTVTARFLYKGEFEFRPAFKLWLAANDAPRVSNVDDALWRRILRLPFDRTVPERERDPAVKATLADPAASGAAVLAWAVAGCLEWQRAGLAAPERVRRATRDYRAEQNPLADFVAECCVLGEGQEMGFHELWEGYDGWCERHRIKAGRIKTPQSFGRLMGAFPVEKTSKTRNGRVQRVYLGVGLRSGIDDPDVVDSTNADRVRKRQADKNRKKRRRQGEV